MRRTLVLGGICRAIGRTHVLRLQHLYSCTVQQGCTCQVQRIVTGYVTPIGQRCFVDWFLWQGLPGATT